VSAASQPRVSPKARWGRQQVAQLARLDDGLLHVLVIRKFPRRNCSPRCASCRRSRPTANVFSTANLWADFHAANPVPVNLDVEQAEFTRVRHEAVPAALRLIALANLREPATV